MILITGATGFIGNNLANHLAKNHKIIAIVREKTDTLDPAIHQVIVFDFNEIYKCSSIFTGIDTVIHCAGMAHIPPNNSKIFINEVINTNTTYTKILAEISSKNKVSNFIYLSTSKIHGEESRDNSRFREHDTPNPMDIYALSKLNAENYLKAICSNSIMKYIILRPPLVYGFGVKANFKLLYLAARLGIPLPIGNINNSRSFISIDNLISIIDAFIIQRKFSNSTFLVSDDDDVSIKELYLKICKSLNKRCNIIYVNKKLLKFIFLIFGKNKVYNKISSNFKIDISNVKRELAWSPSTSMDETLNKMNSYNQL